MKNEPLIGIFDSGVGGFSVLREVKKNTIANIIYFGDCNRAPYGNRSDTEIIGFIKEIILLLKQKGVTHFISACNSMSVHTTEMVLQEVGITRDRYIDMVDAVKKIDFPPHAKVLVIGTQATLTSGVYQSVLSGKGVHSEVIPLPLLASFIENDDKKGITESVALAVQQAILCTCTHILYACTHYPLVDNFFKEEAKHARWRGEFVDPAHSVAEEIKRWDVFGSGTIAFQTTKETEMFKKYSSQVW